MVVARSRKKEKRMKKILLMLALLAVCLSARAELEDRMWNASWTSTGTSWPGVGFGWFPAGAYDGYGYGWYAEVYNVSQAGHAFSYSDVSSPYSTALLNYADPEYPTSPGLGWYDGYGYLIDEAVFGTAKDLDTVQMVFYNNADKGNATALLLSDPLTLPDAPEIAGPDDVRVTFVNFHAIPEPSTALLLAAGGCIAWIARLKQRW